MTADSSAEYDTSIYVEQRAEASSRLIGEACARRGESLEMLLGLLDGGCSLDEMIEALVMHGELPAVSERDGRDDVLYLVESPDEGWRFAG